MAVLLFLEKTTSTRISGFQVNSGAANRLILGEISCKTVCTSNGWKECFSFISAFVPFPACFKVFEMDRLGTFQIKAFFFGSNQIKVLIPFGPFLIGLTSPLSCRARFIVLWDIRNLSIINCEQIQTRSKWSWPVLVMGRRGVEGGGGFLGGGRGLEIALNRDYFLLWGLLRCLVVGGEAGLGT